MRPIPSLAAASLLACALAAAAAAQEARPAPDLSIPPVVQAWADAWNSYDADAMAALFAEDGVYRDEAFQATFTGRDGVRAWVQITAAAIPESEVELIDAFQSGDRVAVRWVFHGTPLNFGPIQATGASFSVPAVTIIDLEEGRIAHLTDTSTWPTCSGRRGSTPAAGCRRTLEARSPSGWGAPARHPTKPPPQTIKAGAAPAAAPVAIPRTDCALIVDSVEKLGPVPAEALFGWSS